MYGIGTGFFFSLFFHSASLHPNERISHIENLNFLVFCFLDSIYNNTYQQWLNVSPTEEEIHVCFESYRLIEGRFESPVV